MDAMSGSPSPFRSATETETGMLVSAIVPLVVSTGKAPRSPASTPEASTPPHRLSRRNPVSNPGFPTMFFGAAGAGAWANNVAVKTRHPAWARKENREIRMRRTVILWAVRAMKSIQTLMKKSGKSLFRPISHADGTMEGTRREGAVV